MKIIPVLRCFVIVLCLLSARPLLAQEVPPRALVDVSAKDVAERFKPSTSQVAASPVAADAMPGVVVTIEPGADAYPGVRLKPLGAETWDLSSYGHVEARITNTGEGPLRINLRVDNAGASSTGPWNTEMATIGAGKSATVRTIFGYSYGFNPGFALKPDAVVAVVIFAAKSENVQSFRIESILAGGPRGEKPSAAGAQRVKPKDGILLGAGVTIDAGKQLETTRGAKASLDADAIVATYPAGASPRAVLLKPMAGFWHLGDATQVRVKLKNTGDSAVAPIVRVASAEAYAERIAESIAPGAEVVIVVPFEAVVAWKGVPADQRKGNDAMPGTGTLYASDKTDSVSVIVSAESAAALRIESIVADSAVAVLPEWVGKRPPVEGEWVSTFSEDFDAATLDATKWNNEGPNHWDKVSHWSKDNTILGDGVMRLRFEKKTGFHNDDPKLKQTDLASGYLDTFDKFKQKYGYFEARMKLVKAPGIWPAFWMMPDRGPNSGDKPGSKAKRCTTSNSGMEFDIMEQLGVWGPNRYNIALHWDDYGPEHKHLGTGKVYATPDRDGFVTSGLLWLPGVAVFYCNGQEVGRWEDPRVSSVPGYMIFTLPAGGWDGNVLDVAALPDDFVIDYVRVWQRRDLIEPPTPAGAVDSAK